MIKPIHNEGDYKIALERVEALWGAKQLGPKRRVSDVLNRKRHLTLPQIAKLHKELHIPYESLIEERYYL
ncbi:hypothetical protein [Legionella genomosp. 1]|uniref:hypothetical protein n=1 Tax=Legionella genomosp. 1 TaxID=1093625 RepID=UPI001055EEE0|nr:hypothetical protein [Legionella genomosp. 1]